MGSRRRTHLTNLIVPLQQQDRNQMSSVGRDVVVIANAGAVQAIPALEEQLTCQLMSTRNSASRLVWRSSRSVTDIFMEFSAGAGDARGRYNIPDSVFSDLKEKRRFWAPELQTGRCPQCSVNTAGVHASIDFRAKSWIWQQPDNTWISALAASSPVPQLSHCHLGGEGFGSDSRQGVNTADHCGGPESSNRIQRDHC